MVAESQWHRRAPAQALRTLVDAYVGYRLVGHPPAVHRGLPSRHLTFIISIGPPIEVIRQTDPAQAPGRYRTVIGGLQATSALIADGGAQEGVQVDLSPLGAAVLLGVPAAALWDLSVELATVVGAGGDQLWERVQEAESWDARFSACDDVLVSWLLGARPQTFGVPVARAWQAIVGSDGRLGTEELAGRAGYSRQHFARIFRRELGLGPKLASRVVRFDHAAHLLRQAGPQVPLAVIAQLCGYADQAHLCRDVAEFAGCTPTELIAGDVPVLGEQAPLAAVTQGAERSPRAMRPGHEGP